MDHETLCRLDDVFASRFPQQFWGRWGRVRDFVQENNTDKFKQALASTNNRFAHPYWGFRGELCLDITGVVFPGEVRRLQLRDGWIFLRQIGRVPIKRANIPKPESIATSFIQAQRCGKDELSSRTPEISFASTKTICVIGLGCIGATLALELAKNGFQLVLVDDDEVEFGPTVRWPLGFQYLGWPKAEALADFIAKQWPHCRALPKVHDVGKDQEVDSQLIVDVDLVLDATAELGVQRYLSDLAAVSQKPLIMISGTPGGWGGRIARFLPTRETEPCRMCLDLYEADHELTLPPADPRGAFQPVGCGDISFHAVSADTSEISLSGARLVLSTLSAGVEEAYPSVWWNVGTLSLRSSDGKLIEPKFETWHLAPHPQCRNH